MHASYSRALSFCSQVAEPPQTPSSFVGTPLARLPEKKDKFGASHSGKKLTEKEEEEKKKLEKEKEAEEKKKKDKEPPKVLDAKARFVRPRERLEPEVEVFLRILGTILLMDDNQTPNVLY